MTDQDRWAAWDAWEVAARTATRAALHGPADREQAQARRLWTIAATLGADDRPKQRRVA